MHMNYTRQDVEPECKAALLHIRTATPKGSVTEKMYSQSLCSIYAQYGNSGKRVLTLSPRLVSLQV